MNKTLKIMGALILILIAPTALSAFSFEPISISLTPEGRGSTGSFLLKNEGDEPVALRISLFERTMDLDGGETRVPADHLFVIYPSRIVLRPRSVQTLRVKWNGGPGFDRERSFRILVEQLAVDFGAEAPQSSGLQIMFRYLGAIYITPPGAAPEVVAESVSLNGEDRLDMILYNKGSAHFIVDDMDIRLTETVGGQPVSVLIPVAGLAGVEGENILAGSRRRFTVVLPQGLRGDNTDVELVFR